MTAAKEITDYKLDFVGVQEVRWGRGGTEVNTCDYRIIDIDRDFSFFTMRF
jgi:hypothetical protein